MGQTTCCTPDSDTNMVYNPNGSNMNSTHKFDGEKYTSVQKLPKLNAYV